MPPSLALLLWLVLLLGLLLFDPAKEPETSPALWAPLIWMFVAASRLPSQWLGLQGMASQAEALEEGNPLNRTFFLVFILLAIGILMWRHFKWGDFVLRNIALVAFVSFALLSIFWSDFAFVAFKRWYRDLGNYLMALVVLSDPRPFEAVRTLLRRLCYLLIPLSIVFVKYYPNLGRQYDIWTGMVQESGVTTSKNMLGVLCLVSGIFFFWDTVTRWPSRKEGRTRRIIMVDFAFLAMTLWLLNLASSATSSVCLVIGCMVIVAAHLRWTKRHPGFLKVLVPASFCLYLILGFGFEMNGELAGAVGRNPTLTDRTLIWNVVLNAGTNPLIGTGYESFWLGPRLRSVWRSFPGVNESHNGYLEVYLNLGLIGVFLIGGVLISCYRNICRQLTSSPSLASLNWAFWTVVLFYNMTEAGFKGGLLWCTFLLGAIAVRERAEDRVRTVDAVESAAVTARVLRPSLEVARQRR